MNLLLEAEGKTPDSPSVQSGKATGRFLVFDLFCLYVGTYLQVYFPLCPYFMRCPSESWVEKLKQQNGSVCGKMKRGKKMDKIEY